MQARTPSAGIHAPKDNAGNADSTDTDDTGSTEIHTGSFYNSDHEDNTDNLNITKIVYNSDYNLIFHSCLYCLLQSWFSRKMELVLVLPCTVTDER